MALAPAVQVAGPSVGMAVGWAAPGTEVLAGSAGWVGTTVGAVGLGIQAVSAIAIATRMINNFGSDGFILSFHQEVTINAAKQ